MRRTHLEYFSSKSGLGAMPRLLSGICWLCIQCFNVILLVVDIVIGQNRLKTSLDMFNIISIFSILVTFASRYYQYGDLVICVGVRGYSSG